MRNEETINNSDQLAFKGERTKRQCYSFYLLFMWFMGWSGFLKRHNLIKYKYKQWRTVQLKYTMYVLCITTYTIRALWIEGLRRCIRSIHNNNNIWSRMVYRVPIPYTIHHTAIIHLFTWATLHSKIVIIISNKKLISIWRCMRWPEKCYHRTHCTPVYFASICI